MKLAVREVLTANRVSERRIAEEIDVAVSLFHRRLDQDVKDSHLLALDIVRMPREVQVGLLRVWAAELGLDVVPTGLAMDQKSAVLTASGMLAEVSATATRLMAASEDGRLDRIEAGPLREKAVAARDRLSGVVRSCDVAIRDGVAPLLSSVRGGDA